MLNHSRAEEVWRLLQKRGGEQHIQGGPACTARGRGCGRDGEDNSGPVQVQV